MEAYEATRIVYSRVQAVDPDNVSKIMGYLLLEDQGERQIFGLAMGPDALLQSAVARARMQLGLLDSASASASAAAATQVMLQPPSPSPPPPPPRGVDHIHSPPPPLGSGSFQRRQHSSGAASFSGGVFPNDHFYPETFAFLNSSKIKAETSGAGWPLDDPGDDHIHLRWSCCCNWPKPCVYYSRGFCKHGSSCRFSHDHIVDPSSPGGPDPPVDGQGPQHDHPPPEQQQQQQQQQTGDGSSPSPSSLERLDRELQELLSSRTSPVSIAALPQLYYERFGRPLQAEGYLTESQRHGKSGYNLTRLLSKLKGSITVIDRPHGQHAVVLAEDAHKFATFAGEHYDLSGVNPSSRQIYLTFPAESSFSEDDVSIHFRAYGPVQDVRIPFQQKRMFGFVTFVYPETVKIVLSEGNPHYICGARVLVKPYRERGKHGDRKHLDKSDSSKYVDLASKDSSHVLSFHDAGRFQSQDDPGISSASFERSDRITFGVADKKLTNWVTAAASCPSQRSQEQTLCTRNP
ncbi:zinc finger CCCH domain-containing protein 18 [Selaginella moellendorffii]|uniref:zinc finger CCCH domain-containing protein 18 n=1 Tax=Selaginella moellendorffii TaxID=88036 RepID=UPI000D1CDB3B|nr:zinc finger CCCH domain-containing protein 18 [Selaginella moellendorffii]|eukprot:XP_024516640.1 zinc finger CCCH domain-containing protein 18 [Selaginella moellendorffii]